eukprot:TRINITY_DN6177_c0_g3_i3.p1 TRINITY_DN6177_c0_g3~~TRINITY_DN6177_c0_g3_i3.p1  ORF type:complete len:301 (-),score=48.50 TRINITY_DN6177_c0_g3_i3:137-976(-)
MASEHRVLPCDDDVEMSLASSSDSEPEAASPAGLQISRAGRVGLALLGAVALVAAAKSHAGSLLTTASQGFQEKQIFAMGQAATNAAPPPSQITSVNQLTGGKGTVPTQPTSPLAPVEDTNDGNPCEDDEEDHLGLCYKKCSLLTNGEAPIRISAFGCAKSHSLGDVFGEKMAGIIPCSGYDISGDAAGNGCPHRYGACLVDEEMSLGKCSKKCSLLTHNVYPHRTSASSCCKTTHIIECLKPTNSKMSSDFATGGGVQGDGIKGDSLSHDPIQILTEQ